MKFTYQLFLLFLITITSCSKENEVDKLSLDACISSVELTSNNADYNSYLKNLALWDCQEIETYSFINVNKGEECGNTEHLVKIKDNVIIETELVKLNFLENFCLFYTIDEIYSIIEEALDPSIKHSITPSLEVDVAEQYLIEYDTIIGIPIKLRIDYLFGIADEEFEFELRDFEAQ